MKKQSGKTAIETHDLRQRRYPLPGTDLGTVNAQPDDFVPDVDLRIPRHESNNNYWPAQHTFSVKGTRS